MEIKIKRLNKNALIPTRGSLSAAGYDLYACFDSESVVIKAHTVLKIGTGLSIQIPEGYFGGIFARSGLASKQGLRPANCVGVADSDYRGEYIVPLFNDSDEDKVINNHERIAQLVILPFLSAEFKECDSLDTTERGANGFGSSGR